MNEDYQPKWFKTLNAGYTVSVFVFLLLTIVLCVASCQFEIVAFASCKVVACITAFVFFIGIVVLGLLDFIFFFKSEERKD